jgi:hypothetical protein
VPAEEITPQVRVEAPATVRSQIKAMIKGCRLFTGQSWHPNPTRGWGTLPT